MRLASAYGAFARVFIPPIFVNCSQFFDPIQFPPQNRNKKTPTKKTKLLYNHNEKDTEVFQSIKSIKITYECM